MGQSSALCTHSFKPAVHSGSQLRAHATSPTLVLKGTQARENIKTLLEAADLILKRFGLLVKHL